MDILKVAEECGAYIDDSHNRYSGIRINFLDRELNEFAERIRADERKKAVNNDERIR